MSAASPSDQAGVSLGEVVQLSLLITDTDRAVAFYRDVLELTYLFTFGQLTFFNVHGLRLYLHEVPEEEWKPGSVAYFLVDDITQTYDVLVERGVTTDSPPHVVYTDESTGIQEWMAFFTDSEGNTLALLSRVPTR